MAARLFRYHRGLVAKEKMHFLAVHKCVFVREHPEQMHRFLGGGKHPAEQRNEFQAEGSDGVLTFANQLNRGLFINDKDRHKLDVQTFFQ